MSNTENGLPGLQIADSSEAANEKGEHADNDYLPRVKAPYTIFTQPLKLAIVILVAFASVFSPLSSFIYYPAIK